MAGWSKKPLLGLMGLSDGDPVVHEKSKDVVQHQLDVIKAALEKDGRVDVVVADNLVTSVASARAEAEKLKAKGVDGTIFSYGVFAWPNFSAIAAKYGQGPYLLAAQLNPDWPGMVAMLAAGGALNQQGGKTILMVTHSSMAASYASRVLFIRDGEIFAQLYRGEDDNRAFFDRIVANLSVLSDGGADIG